MRTNRSTLLIVATGLGKTVVFSHIAGDYISRGRVMVLAHREELVTQAWRSLKRITGYEPDMEMGEWQAQTYGVWQSPIVVGTIQTQIAGFGGQGRMRKFDPADFSLLVIDEAHHAAAASYREVIGYYTCNPNLKVLGVTATPDRADERALGGIFQTVAFEMDIRDGIDGGWLVPVEQQSVDVEGLDYSSVRTTAGDLNGADLARVLEFEDALHGIASPTVDLCGDRKTLIFAASLAQAERLCEILNRHKPDSADWVHGGTPKDKRRELFERYASRQFQYLVNVGVATEGFDDPGIQVVVMARPTKSRSLYAQMAGRGTRPLPGLIEDREDAQQRQAAILASGKPCVEIIDFVGNCGRHKLVTSADILGGRYSDQIVDRAKKNAERKSADAGKPVDVIEELEEAERQIEEERRKAEEAARRSHLRVRAKYSTAKVNPFDVLHIEPCREPAWHKDRQPTPKQVAFLERSGVDVAGLSFTHARQIIDTIIKNREDGRCSFKQAQVLSWHGYDPREITFKQARTIINEMAANGWRPIG
ncbi:MAG: DEAD/DEAH box helicase family protein [Planctomycetes bacterium]|nr:DEAD/DEAH box helicase family protein [Planctomycetota bacterium]